MKFGKQNAKNILATIGWTILISFVILWALYNGHSYSFEALTTYGPSLMIDDLVLVFAVSVLAGLVLLDLESIMLGSLGALGLSAVIVYVCINLPSYLGIVSYPVLQQYLQIGAIVFIFRSFLLSAILSIIGALLGGLLGERIHIED